MEPSYASRSSEELVSKFHEINAELRTHFLSGASWEEQRERILSLNEISKELARRKIEPFLDQDNTSPAREG